MQPSGEASHRIAKLAAHLHPPNLQMEEKWWLRRSDCRAKGGAPGFKVAILGAAGGIGQPLAMLMKMNPLVSVLHLYDVVNSPGVTADLSHMDTGAVVISVEFIFLFINFEVTISLQELFLHSRQYGPWLLGPATVGKRTHRNGSRYHSCRSSSKARNDERRSVQNQRRNCSDPLRGVAKCCPNAIVNLISNPVNSTVPIAAEVFKKAGTYNPKKLLGVTTLDVARANTFVAEVLGIDPRDVNVPVVGGHAGVTILPLLSQVNPPSSFTPEEIAYLTDRIQNGGTEVVEAKAGTGSATLSMAYAAAKFADACLRGLRGDAGIVECSYVASQVTELPFFATKVRIGRQGIDEFLPLGPLNEFERAGLEKAKKELAESIQKGVSFINK
uniref:Malate dehydrogenase n=1 Tax=Ananas comosus var. bracteatus TaxID=296719 RepID=A0A6V7QED1_ANACO|nr:unnamed protein product [Ananas comosus var. bracteatus]